MSATRKYTIWGALFGCCFPVVGTFVQAWSAYGCCNAAGLLRVQAESPLIWIIDSAPFWLGLFARWVGKREDRLTRLIHEQESTIDERTADLKVALERVEGASRAKSRFLANMSHEIRTPMTAILGYAENLLDPRLETDERADAVHIIHNNGQHLLEVINEILDFSKIEAGKLQVERVPCSPLEIVADAADLMAVHAASKGIDFVTEFGGPVPAVMNSDPTRIRQILLNLLGNAIKFTERGSVRLNVALVTGPGDEPHLEFEVQDTGVGMTNEQIENVFRSFAQADGSTSRRYGGTGLGLSICKRLVDMLGGACRVESEPQAGSTFAVSLPTGSLDGVEMIAAPDLAAGRRARTVAPGPPPGGQDLAGYHVLLAEDNLVNSRLVVSILEKAGARVTAAEDGEVAVAKALAARDKGAPHDLILMDIQMPQLDGYAATRQLRQAGCTAPIVALTAGALAGERERCLAAGCQDYLTKPINRTAFLETVRRWLGEPVGPPREPVPSPDASATPPQPV